MTKAFIKGAPFSMDDSVICAALDRYGKVLTGSIKHQKVKGYNHIRTGARMLELLNVKTPIPYELDIGGRKLEILCDNNKTECKFCH